MTLRKPFFHAVNHQAANRECCRCRGRVANVQDAVGLVDKEIIDDRAVGCNCLGADAGRCWFQKVRLDRRQ